MRVGYLMHGIFYGGATRSFQLLLKSIRNYGIEKYIFTISSRSKEIENWLRKEVNGFEFVDLKILENNQISNESYEIAMKKASKSIDEFLAQIVKYKIDILHINTSVFPHIPRLVKSKLRKIKIITHVRELIPDYNNGLQKYFIREIEEFSDKIICISDNEAIPFENSSKIIVLPNPFDFNSINAVEPRLRQKFELDKNIILIGMLSHFSEAKGHLEFLKTLSILRTELKGYDYKFVIIGIKKSPFWKKIIKRVVIKNDYEKRVFDLIKKNDLERSILLIPYTNYPLDYLIDLDIVVRPSITSDPWGRDIIEAMALGKPVIATGTSDYYIKDGLNGYLVPPKNHVEMAYRITDLIKDGQKRKKFGDFSIKMIKGMCNLENYGERIISIYER